MQKDRLPGSMKTKLNTFERLDIKYFKIALGLDMDTHIVKNKTKKQIGRASCRERV